MLRFAHQFLRRGGIAVRLAAVRGRLAKAVTSPTTIFAVQTSIRFLLKAEAPTM
jgi:hypothetical protein